MPLFYVLHNFVLSNSPEFSGGRRNCATFLVGAVLFALLYGCVMHLKYLYGKVVDSLLLVLFWIVLADASTMAMEYKLYYGRTILHELNDDDSEKFEFLHDTHKYVRLSPERLEQKRAGKAALARGVQIQEEKRRIRAAKTIQRWWRSKLYNPTDGILYLRARRDFAELAEITQDEL